MNKHRGLIESGCCGALIGSDIHFAVISARNLKLHAATFDLHLIDDKRFDWSREDTLIWLFLRDFMKMGTLAQTTNLSIQNRHLIGK